MYHRPTLATVAGGALTGDMKGLGERWAALPLGVKLFSTTFACIGAIFSAYIAYDLRTTYLQLTALERDTLGSLSPLLADAVENAMLRESREHIDEVFESLRKGPAVSYAQLLDADGRAVNTADFRTGEEVRRSDLPPLDRDKWLTMKFPLPFKPSCARCHERDKPLLGYIRLISPLDRTARGLRAHSRYALSMFFGGVFLFGASSLFLVRRLVHRPMRRIADAMEEVGRGRLETRIDTPLTGEFGTIARGFNSMVGTLQKDRQEIVGLHRRQVAHMDRLASLGELTAHLAHEVRNPLTGIGSAIQVLLRDHPEGDPRRAVLIQILDQLARMNRTMANFLEYSRVPKTEVRPFSLRAALDRVLFLIESRLRSQSIRLVERVPEDLPRVKANPEQMQQVLLNLLLNAAQAMPSGGELTVSAEAESPGTILAQVRDSGPGVPADDLDNIFRPFFTTRKGGSGLGLPVVKQIVQAYGGEVWIENAPGGGASVFLRLPSGLEETG
ncbi:MAG: ATP-binding protein [Elusimicrobiota bacterium]